jgi:hypothetical protein
MEAVVEATALDWTIARPPRLVRSSDASFQSRNGALPKGSDTVSFRGVAACMLASVEQRLHVGQIVGVTR